MTKAQPTIESESLELAKLVERERELQREMEALKIEKRRRLATIRDLAGGSASSPEPQRESSKKERVQDAVFGFDLGSEFTTGDLAKVLDIDPDIVSNYLSELSRRGYLQRNGRGRFMLMRKEM